MYPSFVDIVVARNKKIRERLGAQTVEYNRSYVSVDEITQKIAVPLTEDQSLFVFHRSDSNQNFGCDLKQNQIGVIMNGKRLHYPQCSYETKTVHSFMIYRDIIEYNELVDTRTPSLRCFPFISKAKKWTSILKDSA